MNLIAILMILNPLVIAGWWILTGHPYKGWAFTLASLSIFVGIVLLLQDRVTEVTIKSIGTIKAAAKDAAADASAIRELREQMEAQRATVDLVAKEATKAMSIAKQLEELLEFTRTIVAAQNDSRKDFDKLKRYRGDESSPFRMLAAHALITIRLEYGGVIEPGYLNLPSNVDIREYLPNEILKQYRTTPSVFHAALVEAFYKRKDIPRYDKLNLCAEVLKDDDSLIATYYAGKFLSQASGIKWSPFSVEPLLEWWEANKTQVSKE